MPTFAMRRYAAAAIILLASAHLAQAEETTVTINLLGGDGVGSAIGTVKFQDGPGGVTATPSLKGLPAGLHGFHVHENPSCAAMEKDGQKVAGLGAGGHYDPHKAGKHAGPAGDGHLGDLPALDVSADGGAMKPVISSRIKVADLKGRALVIHAGGDNYADQPAPLGGGGPRIACGVFP
jgi:Cu-Zn family superoxide dismutase